MVIGVSAHHGRDDARGARGEGVLFVAVKAVNVREAPERKRFEILVDGEVVGFAVYHLEDGRAAIPHTEVDPAHGGQGLASELVHTVLEAARQHEHQVLPYCPFVSAYIRKHTEYIGLVPAAERASFGLPPPAPPDAH
ncbi:MAG: N-acetyltransferase [Nocardioidaceae bacterium]|nr:N-acetyltransferase [Nocardioidaceae bacterium]